MKPSVAFEQNREFIREAAARRRHGHRRGDVDILVDTLPNTDLFDLGGLQADLEDRLGVPVDIVTSGGLHRFIKDRVLAEAIPV